MARQRELLVNIERIRREMDEFFGDAWSRAPAGGRRPGAFAPRVDVYYCEPEESGRGPRAIVKADLAGVDPDAVSLEISGRELVMSGSRPVRETEGRAYQQVEIPTGPFRRVIELGVEVVAERGERDLRGRHSADRACPSRPWSRRARKVPIERAE